MTMMNSADFDNAANELGEEVTLITNTQTQNTDSGSIRTNSEATATTTAIVQNGDAGKHLAPEGKPVFGSLFVMFKAAVTPTSDQNFTVTRTGSRYRIVKIATIAPSGSVHHHEVYAEFIR